MKWERVANIGQVIVMYLGHKGSKVFHLTRTMRV